MPSHTPTNRVSSEYDATNFNPNSTLPQRSQFEVQSKEDSHSHNPHNINAFVLSTLLGPKVVCAKLLHAILICF